jgi:hypothetical protein
MTAAQARQPRIPTGRRRRRSLQSALPYVSLGGLLALGAVLSASCVPADPDPASSPPPDVCSNPGVFAETWTAQVTEPNASGVYKITFKPADLAAGIHTVGTYSFVRDVTYGSSPPELAGCRAITFHGGSYVAEGGAIKLYMSIGTEVREGCTDPANNDPSISVSTPDEVYRSAINGPYTLTACSLTINSLVFTNGLGPQPDGGAGDGGPPECTPALQESCYGHVTCYTDIFKDCIPGTVCTAGEQAVVADDFVAPFCFDSGVKVKVTTNPNEPLKTTVETYKSSGELCHKAESTSTTAGDNTIVYKDVNDAELATVKQLGGSLVSITCAGMPEVTLTDAACACTPVEPMCTPGACSIP